MRLLGAIGLPLVVIAAGGIVLWEARGLGRLGRPGELGPGFWPTVWGVVCVAAGVVGVAEGVCGRAGRRAGPSEGVRGEEEVERVAWWRWMWATGVVAAYFFAVERIGFLWATVGGLMAFAALEEGLRRRWWLLGLFGLLGGLGMAWVFVRILGSPLPVGRGLWGELTGKVYRVLGIWGF